jgi:uncharacterized protein (DUF486 family)
MTFAWYGQLKFPNTALWILIPASWGIALLEYCFAVPANKIGHQVYSAAQLKTMQEVITLIVFAIFSVTYLGESLKWNHGMESWRRLRLDRGGCVFRISQILRRPVRRIGGGNKAISKMGYTLDISPWSHIVSSSLFSHWFYLLQQRFSHEIQHGHARLVSGTRHQIKLFARRFDAVEIRLGQFWKSG